MMPSLVQVGGWLIGLWLAFVMVELAHLIWVARKWLERPRFVEIEMTETAHGIVVETPLGVHVTVTKRTEAA